MNKKMSKEVFKKAHWQAKNFIKVCLAVSFAFLFTNIGFAEVITPHADNIPNKLSNNQAVNKDAQFLLNGKYLGYKSARDYAVHHIKSKDLKSYPGTVNNNPYVVGSLAGKLNIGANGAASYAVPISVSPGTAGMTPQLSIAYNSQQKNGLLGMGFSLSGLTAITRAPQNKAQNGKLHGVDFTNEDRFSLNGQQLVAVKGNYGENEAEYRTYLDSEAKIKSYGQQGNGPAYFQVWTKGGQMAEYAKTSDSQQIAQGQNDVETWGLDKIIDTAGNYLQVKYHNDADTGSFYPTEIDYTGNDAAEMTPYNKVKFVYEDRPDVQKKYVAGSKITMDKRLKEVQVYTQDKLTYDYKLTYDQSPSSGNSRLINVEECAGDSCLTPTKFSWNNGVRGFTNLDQYKPPVKIVDSYKIGLNYHTRFSGINFIDLNGNGLTDVYYQSKWDGGKGAWINDGNTWQSSTAYAPHTVYSGSRGADNGVIFADLTGNGLMDVVQSYFKTANAWINTGSGWVKSEAYAPPAQITFWDKYPTEQGGHAKNINKTQNSENDDDGIGADVEQGVRFIDLNGNGRADMVQNVTQEVFGAKKGAWINTGSGWQKDDNYIPPTPITYNHVIEHESKGSGWTEIQYHDQGFRFVHLTNSGLPDIVSNAGAWINTGSGWKQADNYSLPVQVTVLGGKDNSESKDNGVRFIDLTGNGLTDIVSDDGAWINTGKDWLKADNYKLPDDLKVKIVDSEHYDQGIRFFDVNGNGLPDLVQCNYLGGFDVWLNTGTGWKKDDKGEYAAGSELSDRYGLNLARFIDPQGTGLLGIISDKTNGTSINTLKGPDLLTGIKDGVGKNTTISYDPLTNVGGKDVYTKEHNAIYPNADFQGAMYVVSQTSEDTDDTDPTTSNLHKGSKNNIGNINNKDARKKLQAEDQHITKYHYIGAKLNHTGWGFLGFHQVQITDETTGIYAIDTYSQDATGHLLGKLLHKETHANDGTLLTDIQNTWNSRIFGDGSKNNTYYLLCLKQNVKKSFSLTGKLISTQTTNIEIDDYANPTKLSKITQDDFGTYTTTTTSAYNNDIKKWFLGELTHAEVNATINGVSAFSKHLTARSRKTNNTALQMIAKIKQKLGASSDPNDITRASDFTYDKNTGMLVSTIANPDKLNFKTTKTVIRDKFGNIIQSTVSPAGLNDRITKNKYDDHGRCVIAATNALNQTITQQIDPRFGKPTTTTDLNGLKTTYTYNDFGQLLKKTNPSGTEETTEYKWYDHYGINDSLTDPLYYAVYYTDTHTTDGDTVTTYYDMLNRKVATTHHGFNGGLIWQSAQYDNLGRVTQQSIPFNPSDQPLYTSFEYDVLGRVVKITKADESVILNKYDGLSITTINQLNQTATQEKDARGDLAKTIDHAGNITKYQYDAFGNLTSMTDSEKNISTITYDDLGHKIVIDDPDKGNWVYEYDSLGKLINQLDANNFAVNGVSQTNQITTFKYDNLGRMIAKTDAAGTSIWMYGNDKSKHNVNMLVQVSGVASLSKKSKGIFYVEKPSASQLIKASKQNVVNYQRTYAYDALSRPIKTAITINGQSYAKQVEYDKDSRVKYITYPNNEKVENIYDDLGRLSIVATLDRPVYNYWILYSMTPRMQVESFASGNGLVTTKTYNQATGYLENIQTKLDEAGVMQKKIIHSASVIPRLDRGIQEKHLVSRVHQSNAEIKNDSAIIQNLNYSYDALGQLKQKDDLVNDIHETYVHDNLNRLTSWNYDGLSKQLSAASNDNANNKREKNIATAGSVTYQYDELGNLTYKSDVGHYKYGNAAGPHAATSIDDDSDKQIGNFVYDADGNQTQATLNGKARTISYTSFGKPKEIKTDTATVNFYYNADRTRFMRVDQASGIKTTTLYLGDYVITSHDDGKKVTTEEKSYIGSNALLVNTSDANGKNETKKLYCMLTDNIGSLTAITDEAGTVIKRFHYTPFGQQAQFKGDQTTYSITHHGFTGHEEIKDVNLIHMNGRLYDPVLGRFLSADTTIQSPDYSQSLNRYSYCVNNPLTLTDPTGYSWVGNLLGHVMPVGQGNGGNLGEMFIQMAMATVAMIVGGPFASALVVSSVSGLFTLANGGNIGMAVLSAGITFTTAKM